MIPTKDFNSIYAAAEKQSKILSGIVQLAV